MTLNTMKSLFPYLLIILKVPYMAAITKQKLLPTSECNTTSIAQVGLLQISVIKIPEWF